MASRIALALIASLVFAAPAVAGDWGRSGWYVGAGGGVGWDFLEDLVEDRVNELCGDKCIDLNTGGTFNFRGGYRLTSWFAVEGMYEGVYGISAKTAKDLICDDVCNPPIAIDKGAKFTDLTLHNFLANAKFILPIKRFQPYFLLGLGAQYHTAKLFPDALGDLLETSRTDLVIRPGVGLDFALTESWMLNSELGIPVSFRDYGDIPSATTDNVSLTLSFGLAYRF